MDRIKNPFAPGAGTPPPELAGREGVLSSANVLLRRAKEGRPERSMILTGLRGVGKTVLLNEIADMARALEFRVIQIEATEDRPLSVLLVQHLRTLLYQLDRVAGAGDKVRRGLAVLRSFLGTIQVGLEDFRVSFDVDPELGSADSGDLEIDLPQLFETIGEAAAERRAQIIILIDEIQYLQSKELGALIMSMHRIQQRQLPFVFVGAGLPVLPGLAGNAKSYAERLFAFPQVGALSLEDAAKALGDPTRAVDVVFDRLAIEEVYRITKGYPYFLQEWGYQCWNVAPDNHITREIVDVATVEAISNLDENFFRVRYDRLTSKEKHFLRAMAELGNEPWRIADLAAILHAKVQSLGPLRAQLIQKGMIYSPRHGEIAFTVPLFDEFMRRSTAFNSSTN